MNRSYPFVRVMRPLFLRLLYCEWYRSMYHHRRSSRRFWGIVRGSLEGGAKIYGEIFFKVFVMEMRSENGDLADGIF